MDSLKTVAQVGTYCIWLMLSSPAAVEPPPPPPITHHHINPETRTVTTAYHCSDGDRQFSIRYSRYQAEVEFVGGTREGIALPPSEVERATNALRQLDGVTSLYPQCSPESDSIIALGFVDQRRAVVYLGGWTIEL